MNAQSPAHSDTGVTPRPRVSADTGDKLAQLATLREQLSSLQATEQALMQEIGQAAAKQDADGLAVCRPKTSLPGTNKEGVTQLEMNETGASVTHLARESRSGPTMGQPVGARPVPEYTPTPIGTSSRHAAYTLWGQGANNVTSLADQAFSLPESPSGQVGFMQRHKNGFGPTRYFNPTVNSPDDGRHAGHSQSAKPKRPANYDGQTSWRDYLVQFDMVAELNPWLNRWDRVTKALELATSLRGGARSVLADLSPEDRNNYESLVAALAARFEPDNQSEVYRAQLKARRRKTGESLTELAQEVRRLTWKAYPSTNAEIREQLASECFIDALNDAELEWAVFQTKPSSLSGAVKAALEYEAFQTGRKRRHGTAKPVRVVQSQIAEPQPNYVQVDAGGDMEATLRMLVGRLSKLEAAPAKKTVPKQKTASATGGSRKGDCHYCKKPGHWLAECPKLHGRNGMRSRNQGKGKHEMHNLPQSLHSRYRETASSWG